MSIVDTTDGDSINSNGLMVKDKRSKTGYKKASDRKVDIKNFSVDQNFSRSILIISTLKISIYYIIRNFHL